MPLAEDTILLKRYRIDGLLAVSGNARATYRAFDINLYTPVVIKESFLPTTEQIAHFKQEAVIWARLRHPALASVINHFSFAGKQYLVIDFIEGDNLAEIIESSRRPLTESEALAHMLQICRGVSYLHQQTPPISHGQIRPQNIKITPANRAILINFGLTGPELEEAISSDENFSAPEQRKTGETSPAADIYSLGATFYLLLTGKAPSSTRKLPPPHKVNPEVSPRLSEAVMAALKSKPADRPKSVVIWQKELEAILEASTSPPLDKAAAALPLPKSDTEDTDETSPNDSARQREIEAIYWLVDATGLGYPIGSELFLIGRSPDADIVIEDQSISRYQTQIRVDNGRCLVQDLESANGTFLNGHRLGSEWYPLRTGDLLTISSARFHLTSTRPVKLAPFKSKSVLPPENDRVFSPAPTDQLPSPVAVKSKPHIARYPLGLIALFVIMGLIGLYLWLNPDRLPFFAISSSPGNDTTAGQSQASEVPADQEDTPAAVAERTRQAEQQATAIQVALDEGATATARAGIAVIVSSESTPIPEATATPTPTSTPTQPHSPIATPTAGSQTLVEVTAVASGPTLVPLEAEEMVDRIGLKEVVDVDINLRNPDEVYAVVKRDGIYKSSKGGDGPWAKLPLDATGVVAFVIDPTNPARFYAPTWNAVLKSTDGGNTWEAKTQGLLANRSVDVVVVDPHNPNILYAGIGETLVGSTDGGETWTSDGYGIGVGLGRLYAVVIDPFNSNVVYVGGLGAAIYKSTDGGRNFVPMPYNTGEGTFSLAAHPAQMDTYLAGINSPQAGIIKTETAWEFDEASEGLIYGGADSAYSAITYAPTNPSIVYAGSGYEENSLAKGIFKSIDGGENWFSINNGLSLNADLGQPYYVKSIAVHPSDPDIVFAATGGGLFKSIDGGASWSLR